MTQLMGRPIMGLPGELGARSVLADLLAGARAALLTLAVVAAPVYGLWVLAPYSDDTAAGAGRLTCALWLLGHGAPLTRGEAAAPLTVTPLLLTAFSAVLLHRAGARLRRRERSDWRAPVAVCAGYLVAAVAAVTQCATDGALRSRPLPDLLAVAALTAAAVTAGFLGADGASRLPALCRLRLPGWLWPSGAGPVVGRAAAAAGCGLVAAGGLVLTGALVLKAGDAGRSAVGLGGGVAGFAALLLSCALLLPDAVVWGAAYALGPGFAVGTSTVVAPTGARLGAVPDFPLFALLPEGPSGGWRLAVCGLPLLAGVVPALVLGRRAVGGRGAAGPDGAEPWRAPATAVAALATALLVGLAAALVALLADGALAAGRMSQLGPTPWRTALAAAAWTAVVTLPGAFLPRLRPAGLAARRAFHRVVSWPA
ncbi:cell division protein PerM [Kitasatospora sp. McL0602]|uniref:cell division protein PerM n=1 Tax=Kitasatospora sp. McL0602 TaxID=3439530 RepID=UPI003F8C88E0